MRGLRKKVLKQLMTLHRQHKQRLKATVVLTDKKKQKTKKQKATTKKQNKDKAK